MWNLWNLWNIEQGRKRKSGIYACQVVKEGSNFKSNQTGNIYKVRQDINCRSENIIYLVTCTKCSMQGVGSCTSFCKRILNYITSIENKSPGCKIEMRFLKPEPFYKRFLNNRHSTASQPTRRSHWKTKGVREVFDD